MPVPYDWREHGEERRTWGRPCGSCEAVDSELFRGISDHAPIVAALSAPA